MGTRFRVEDFGNGFRAFCHESRPLRNWSYIVGALVPKSHVLSRVPYFLASGVNYFEDENGRRLYGAALLHDLRNPDDDYGGEFDEAVAWDADFYRDEVGLTGDDYLWTREVAALDFEDALDGYWPLIEADASALSGITLNALLGQALLASRRRRNFSVFRGPEDRDWLSYICAREELRAAEIKARDDRIRYLESRVVELRGRI